MTRFIKIDEAAKLLGVSVQTLRRWEKSGYLVSTKKQKEKDAIMILMNELVRKNLNAI